MIGFSNDEIEAVRRSGLFDAEWYLAKYPDVRALGMDPLEHYLWLGAKLKRNPSDFFDTAAYLSDNNDVATAGINPLVHYVLVGKKEGREARPRTFVAAEKLAFPRLHFSADPRVLVFSHNLNASEGAPTSLFELCVGLKATAGVGLVVVSPTDGTLRTKYERAGIEVVLSPLALSPFQEAERGDVPAHAAYKIEGMLRDNAVDAVIANTALGFHFAHAARLAGVPSMLIVRESEDPLDHFAKLLSPEWRSVFLDTLRDAERLVFVSDDTRDLWMRSIRRATGAVGVVRNGIDVARLQAPVDREAFRRGLGIRPDEVMFLAVGTICERKNQGQILDALARLPEHARRKAKLVLVGDIANEDYARSVLKRIETEADLAPSVVHVPATSEIERFYTAADVLVQASMVESYPRVVLEALYFRLPIIANPIFGVREQTKSGESALYYDPSLVETLTGRMQEMMAPAVRDRLSNGAARQFAALPDYASMVNGYAALLRQFWNGSAAEIAPQAAATDVVKAGEGKPEKRAVGSVPAAKAEKPAPAKSQPAKAEPAAPTSARGKGENVIQLPLRPRPVLEKAEPALPADAADVIIYSSLFGDYDEVKEPGIAPRPGVRFMLFTDRTDVASERWEVVHVGESVGDLRRNSRLAKMLPHVYLPPHRISIYIDATMAWTADISAEIAEGILDGRDIALYPHKNRTCTYVEMRYCAEQGIVQAEAVQPIIARYEKEGFPAEAGLFENAFIVRRNNRIIEAMNSLWWDEYRRGPHRDQFYLMYVMWKLGIDVSPIKDSNNFRKSKYVTHIKHKQYKKKPGALNISWVLKAELKKGWAYANNTHRFIKALAYDDHTINETDDATDIALYFDSLIYNSTSKRGKRNILRLGGPRPLRRMFRGNIEDRSQFLREFDALIALSPDLARMARISGVPTYLVPNGLDVEEWRYRYEVDRGEFVVGFAANVANNEERRLKGLDKVEQACKALGVTLFSLKKGDGTQIPHERMAEDFFGKISCLVHPVAEGKEGSSNTIMEALACGVPVITTRDCGYHSAFLKDEEDILYSERDKTSIAECIVKLRDSAELRQKLSINGRKFVERQHDIRKIAIEYRNIFTSVMSGRPRTRVSLVPFKLPAETFATARLRCAYLADILNEFAGEHVRADLGLTDDADVILISQLCPEKTLFEVQERRAQGKIIVYDCCDPYFDRQQEVYGIHAAQRFWELVDVAHVVTVSTDAMRVLLTKAGVMKPIVLLPDTIDYREQLNPELVPARPSAVWFGNPGHGNFESGLWALRHLKDRWNHDVTLITRPDKVVHPEGMSIEAWAFEGFTERLRSHGMALVSQDPDANYKSENRYVVCLANGVPAISTGSVSIGRLLSEIGFPEMNVTTVDDLDRAVELLSDEAYRRNYVWQAQAAIETRFGGLFLAKRFMEGVIALRTEREPGSAVGNASAATSPQARTS